MIIGDARPLDEVACIVFSRDRALQLEGLLQSIRRHAPALLGATTVIYRSTSTAFTVTYDALRRDWPELGWVPEKAFDSDVRAAVGARRHTVFHTDDDLYFRGTHRFHLDDETACFSFRLGLNTTYCYPLDVQEDLGGVETNDDVITWRWADFPPGAFSYPLALNAHVFRTTDVGRWVADVEFEDPNTLESALQQRLHELSPRMAAFAESSVVNVPANLVNESFPNRHAGLHSTHELNERFLAGERLDLDAMDFTRVHAAHEEIPYVFRRSGDVQPVRA